MTQAAACVLFLSANGNKCLFVGSVSLFSFALLNVYKLVDPDLVLLPFTVPVYAAGCCCSKLLENQTVDNDDDDDDDPCVKFKAASICFVPIGLAE